VPSYLDQSDNSVVILSQDLGFSEKKMNGFCPSKIIKSPESIKQNIKSPESTFEFIEKAIIRKECGLIEDWSREQIQAKMINRNACKKENEVSDFLDGPNKENVKEQDIL
jgi:hypothetical protein